MKRILIVVAHPDDESFYYGGRMLNNPENDYSVIIVTDGQGDGKPDERQAHLQKASELFRFRILSFGSQKDIEGKRLDVTDIMTILKKYQPDYDEVWTHSPLGDYQSHPHHQDTAIACALIFEDKVRYNHIGLFGCGDEFSLTHEVYKKKMETLYECYSYETSANEIACQYYISERMTSLPNIDSIFLLYAWFAENDVEKIVQEDSRFLDIWQLKTSKYENTKVDITINMLSEINNFNGKRGVVVGDVSGLYSDKLIKSGILERLDGIEVFKKYQQTIERYGSWHRNIDDVEDTQYNLLLLIEVINQYSNKQLENLIVNSCPSFILWIEQEMTSEENFSVYEALGKYKLITKININSEFEYDLHKYFLFRRLGVTVFLFKKNLTKVE